MTTTMDRRTFLNLAPEYYMLALFFHTRGPHEFCTEIGWKREFTINDPDVGEYCYIENDALRAEALRLMVEQDMITTIEDEFGPTIWQASSRLESVAKAFEETPGNVFYKARVSGDPEGWLRAALEKVNYQANGFDVREADFVQTSVGEITLDSTVEVTDPDPVDEWAPITLDQTDPVVSEATKQLGAVTEAIEQDNGYSVTHPQERDAVVSDLKGGLEKMKSGVVSVGFLRRIATALKTGSVRFANTVKGQMIDGTLAAFKDLVKSHASHAMEYLWTLLS